MAFADPDDLALRIGRDLTAGEEPRAQFLLDQASLRIAAVLNEDQAWIDALDPVPPAYKVITIEVAARVFLNPQGVQGTAETLGDHTYSENYQRLDSYGLALTREERREIRRTAAGGTFLPVILVSPYSGDDEDDFDLLDQWPS